MTEEYRYMTDNTESESLLEEGFRDDVVYLNNIFFQGNIAEKYCLYDMDSLMQYIFKNYGEVCYHKICLLGSATHLNKVISVRTSIEEVDGFYSSAARYIFENGFEYDVERTDIDTRKDAEEITKVFEQAAPSIFYLEGHVSGECISFDYEHWG